MGAGAASVETGCGEGILAVVKSLVVLSGYSISKELKKTSLLIVLVMSAWYFYLQELSREFLCCFRSMVLELRSQCQPRPGGRGSAIDSIQALSRIGLRICHWMEYLRRHWRR